MIGFTAVTAAAAVGGVIVSHGQLEAMKSQLAEMRNSSAQTDRAISASNRLAVSAETQASVSQAALDIARQDMGIYSAQLSNVRDTARRQLRPYLRLILNEIDGVGVGQTVVSRLDVSNSGPSSTYETSVATGIGVYRYPDVGDVGSVARKAPPSAVRTVIPPGLSSEMIVRLTPRLQEKDIEILKVGSDVRIYTWAVATYKDSYGSLHHSYACASWRYDDGHWRGEACRIGTDD